MKKSIITLAVMLAATALVVVFCGSAMAKVTGRCDNCHTMHNSQHGSDLYTEPYDVLLKGDCVGCHSSATATQTYLLGTSTVPVVNYTGGIPGTYLAGGNFYWVATLGGGDDAKGHNVLGISIQDVTLTPTKGAPGNQYSGNCQTGGCHGSLADPISGQDDSLKGGCQGCHLKPRHHANDGTGTKYVDSAEKGWYRFLARHSAGPVLDAGVKGIEAANWQATTSSTEHNEYLGVPENKTSSGGTSLTNGSMTAFCCGCHGNFHEQNANAATGPGSQSPWLRHPSDFVIPDVGEYSDISSYDPLSPVARPAGFTWTGGPDGTVAAGTDIVMCLSCHRPHGSAYNDLLRWDYDATVAGTGTSDTGCFYCHTKKNAS